MLLLNKDVETRGLRNAAEYICVAACTVPEGKGKDLLVTALVEDEEKGLLQQQMRLIGERDAVPFFLRDADNLEHAPAVILLGTRKEPLQ